MNRTPLIGPTILPNQREPKEQDEEKAGERIPSSVHSVHLVDLAAALALRGRSIARPRAGLLG
jgi:hypothetical protein